MRFNRQMIVVALAAAMLAQGHAAQAAYVGLSTSGTGVNIGGINYGVIRVYANFSDPNDYVTAVYGSQSSSALSIRNLNSIGTGPGSGFFNPGGPGSNTAPYQDEIDFNPQLAYGTFATIGVPIGDMGSGSLPAPPDQTALAPGFPVFIAGTELINNNIAWFTPGPVEQGRVGYLGDGDAMLRVMLMQLTIRSGEVVVGSINIQGEGSTGQVFNALNQQFFAFAPPPPPAPGTLAALGLGAILGKRRRRN